MHIQSLQPTSIESDSVLSIVANQEGHLKVKVLDVQGKMAKSFETMVREGIQQLSINLADLSSGMYVLNAFSGEMFINSFRFTKQ